VAQPVTGDDLQLRFGRDRLWYRFVRSGGGWMLVCGGMDRRTGSA
jgi:hypothetical protein